jgi:hypothetical protein
LTDIARNYIEEAIEIPAMESTTSELIEALRIASMKKKMALSQETIEKPKKCSSKPIWSNSPNPNRWILKSPKTVKK